MGRLYNNGSAISNVYKVGINAPLDTRLTVNKKSDLTDGVNGIASNVYTGMVVYVHAEKTLYVYIGSSNSNYINNKTGKPINGGLESNWIKIIPDVNKNEVLILDAVGDILDPTKIGDVYKGKIVYVNNSEDTKSNGLYILVDEDGTKLTNWVKISG